MPSATASQAYSAPFAAQNRSIRTETAIFTACSNICTAAYLSTVRRAVKYPLNAQPTDAAGRLSASMRSDDAVRMSPSHSFAISSAPNHTAASIMHPTVSPYSAHRRIIHAP